MSASLAHTTDMTPPARWRLQPVIDWLMHDGRFLSQERLVPELGTPEA